MGGSCERGLLLRQTCMNLIPEGQRLSLEPILEQAALRILGEDSVDQLLKGNLKL